MFLVEVTSTNNVVKPWVREPGMLVSINFIPHLVVYICQTPDYSIYLIRVFTDYEDMQAIVGETHNLRPISETY